MIYVSTSRDNKGFFIPYDNTTTAGITKGMYGNDVYTKTLLHFDTDYTDSSLSGHTFSNNNVSISSVQKKFGPASALFNGTTSYLYTASSADYDFGAGNFAVDTWAYLSAVDAIPVILTKYQDGNNRWSLYLDFVNATGLGFMVYDNNATPVLNLQQGASTGWSIGQWYHIAAFRYGNDWYITRDGLVLASTTSTITIPALAVNFSIGWRGNDVALCYLNGYLDELRVSKGVSRWTGAFTVPTRQYA